MSGSWFIHVTKENTENENDTNNDKTKDNLKQQRLNVNINAHKGRPTNARATTYGMTIISLTNDKTKCWILPKGFIRDRLQEDRVEVSDYRHSIRGSCSYSYTILTDFLKIFTKSKLQ